MRVYQKLYKSRFYLGLFFSFNKQFSTVYYLPCIIRISVIVCHCVLFTGSPTTGAQINLASLRNNSLTNQDNQLDSHGDSRLRNSCMSLDEKTRTMSRSGSFRDGFEEGEKNK